MLAYPSIVQELLPHEETIVVEFAEGRTFPDVVMHLTIPSEYLLRHIGNILLKLVRPADFALIRQAIHDLEAYHAQSQRSSAVSEGDQSHTSPIWRMAWHWFQVLWSHVPEAEATSSPRCTVGPWLRRTAHLML